MPAITTPRRTLRRTAALSALSLTTLLALTAEPAHADGSTCGSTSNTGCLNISLTRKVNNSHGNGQTYSLQLQGGSSSESNDLVLTSGTPANGWNFQPLSANGSSDGTFLIGNNDPSKTGCVTVNNNTGRLTLATSCDPTQTSQKFYAQPSGLPGSYLIRHVGDDKCMSSTATGNQLDSFALTLQGCVQGVNGTSGAGNQPLTITTSPSGGSGPAIDDLAAQYALNQYNNSSGVIRSASYSITDSSQPVSISYVPVTTSYQTDPSSTPVQGTACKNAAGAAQLTCSMNWGASTQNQITQQDSVTLGAGANSDTPLKTQVTAAYQHVWQQSQTSVQTSGSGISLNIPPGDTAWVALALPLKKTTGNWTFTNDVGVTWSHSGTVTLPMTGIDGHSSTAYACDTKSTDPGCLATKPADVQ